MAQAVLLVRIELVVAILLLAGIGHWLDGRYWGGRDWGMTAGFLLGVAVGVRNLVRIAHRMQGDIERAEARDPQAKSWTVDTSWLHDDARDARSNGDSNGRSDPKNVR